MYFALGALALLGAYFVLSPVIFPRTRDAGAGDAVDIEDVRSRRAEVYTSIKDLEFERAMGRIGEEDFRKMRADYKSQAGELMSREEALRADKTLQQIEAAVAKRRSNGSGKSLEKKKQTPAPKAKSVSCPSCQAMVLERFRFCPECGEKMESV
ncbi:MAG: hypothetical protein RL885_18420 [Planctomycetota bacterium]